MLSVFVSIFQYGSFFSAVLAVFVVSEAQTLTITPVGNITAVDGTVLDITCTHNDGVTTGNGILLRQNGAQLIGADTPSNEVTGATRLFHLSVDRTKNGNTYRCASVLNPGQSPLITLTVTCEWNGGSYGFLHHCSALGC